MKISIGTIVLAEGDGSNEQPYDMVINNSRHVQISSAIGAESVRGHDRGNQRTALEFKVARRHISSSAAHAYVIQHAATLKNLSSQLSIFDEQSGETYVLHGAVISDIRSTCEGIISYHYYKIIGGNFTKN